MHGRVCSFRGPRGRLRSPRAVGPGPPCVWLMMCLLYWGLALARRSRRWIRHTTSGKSPLLRVAAPAQRGWQSRSDLETDKVHRPFVNGVRVRADPAQGQSGRDCGAVHVARFPFQIPLDVVMMLFITESKTM